MLDIALYHVFKKLIKADYLIKLYRKIYSTYSKLKQVRKSIRIFQNIFSILQRSLIYLKNNFKIIRVKFG
jgi:RNase P/RNase MRP subunit p30